MVWDDQTHRKTALVCGAGGFVGAHMVRRLMADGYWVRGVDIRAPKYAPTASSEFEIADLRSPTVILDLFRVPGGAIVDEIYQFAADMGGVGFMHSAECEIMRNNSLINLNVLHAAATSGVPNYFFSSSACIYRDMLETERELTEDDAYPALPHNEYGWEKLFAERTAMTYGRTYGMNVRIARLQNCYGPEGTWHGGREKAPAAICRKIAEAKDGGTIDIWGDGTASRAFTYIDDIIDGIRLLMRSALQGGVNVGRREYVSIADLIRIISEISGKVINVHYIEGPVGVQARNFTADRIESLGWSSRTSLRKGLELTYQWIESQVDRQAAIRGS